MKSKLTTIGIILVTVILAGVAIFTAKRLYDTRDTAVAPNVPSSRPAAQVVPTATASAIACALNFTISTPTASPSPTPTRTPSPSPTASPVPLCNSACSTTSDCPSGLSCYIPSGATAGNCRNALCTSATNCVCATVTPTPTRTPSPTPVVTASPNPQCNSACTSNSQCMSGMTCYIPSGSTSGNCRNTQCLTESDCTCPVAVVTTPPAEPTLPEVGTKWPTIIGSVFGILVILGSLVLAL